MGFFDGRSYSASEVRRNSEHRSHTGRLSSRSPQRSSRSPARSAYSSASKGYFVRPSAKSQSSSSNFFGVGVSGGRERERERERDGEQPRSYSSTSTRGWFGGSSSSSYYKRSPRQGYVQYLMRKLQRMLRDLWAYARRHPVKAFFAVVVPLLSAGGAVHGLLRQLGVRVPLIDGQMRTMAGGYYGSDGYGGGGIGGAGGGGGAGWMDSAGSLMQIAKAFM